MATVATLEPEITTLPNKRMYYSPWGLFGFQEEGTARTILRTGEHGVVAIWDTGTGKTHLAMASAALMFEMDLIDRVLVVCERGKLKDWVNDYGKYTTLTTKLYHGTNRKKLLVDKPQVMVSTYETVKADCAPLTKGKKVGQGKELTESLRHDRVFLVYDEITKLRSRKSGNYQSHEFMINAIRKTGNLRILGLTATPVEKDPEDYFNIVRLVAPSLVGTVAWFEKEFVRYRDMYDRPVFNKEKLPEFAKFIAPAVLRKRKTDPDVIKQFPKQVEEVTHVTMGDQQKAFYNTVAAIYDPPEGEQDHRSEEQIMLDDRKLFSALRLIAAYPEALSRAEGKLAKAITEKIGVEGLRAVGSAKTEEFIKRMTAICKDQGDPMVVFTFFGQAVLPLLARDLRSQGISVAEHHGGMNVNAQNEAQRMFKAGEVQIFLSSDAGARGLNFGHAAYVENYEMPVLHSIYIQRINRVHRIDSQHPSVTCHTFIVDDTMEEGLAASAHRRNEYQDMLIDGDSESDENFVSAAVRREILSLRTKR